MTATAAPSPVVVGHHLTYTIGVTNHGPWTATGIALTYTLPAGAEFVSATTSTPTGGIARVEFYDGTKLLGSDTSAPRSARTPGNERSSGMPRILPSRS